MTEYHPIPQPDDIPRKERDDAMGAYLMMFAAWAVGLPLPFLNIIGAIIYVAVNKSSRFVKYHGLHSLYAQIPLTLLNMGLIIWGIVLFLNTSRAADDVFFGFLALVVLSNILYIIFSFIALVRARRGEMYYFIFFGKLAYHHAFRIKRSEMTGRVNAPPKM